MGKAEFYISSSFQFLAPSHSSVIRAYGVGKPAEQAARLSRHLNTPLVISLHGNYDLDNRYQTLRRGVLVKYLYYTFRSWFIIPKILKQAAKILAVYQFAADYALSKNIAKDKVAVIYNRVYPDIFFPSADKKRKKFTLIMVGRLISEKNQQCLIRAIQNLDVQLIIVGQGPEEENLKKLSESLGIASGVEFVSKTDNREMASLYNQAHAYVTANQYGGLEIPVIEAIACGLPIIRSKHPLEKEPELLGFNGCLCVENNPEAFAAAIKKLMGDQELYRRLSRKSLEIYQSINGCKMEEKEKKLVLSVL